VRTEGDDQGGSCNRNHDTVSERYFLMKNNSVCMCEHFLAPGEDHTAVPVLQSNFQSVWVLEPEFKNCTEGTYKTDGKEPC
jgi:hypothetical protein